MVALATQRCAGGNLPRLNPKQLEVFGIPLPHKNGKLLLHYLNFVDAKRKAGAIFQNLTTIDTKVMEVPVPPRQLQLKFDGLAACATEFRGRQLNVDGDAVGLFAPLQQRAFRGEL